MKSSSSTCLMRDGKLLEEIGGAMYRQGLKNEVVLERLKNFRPTLVVMPIPFSGWAKAAFQVAATVKEADRNIKVAVFGLHPSARPKECLRQEMVDFVVIGEPEMTVLELSKHFSEGRRG